MHRSILAAAALALSISTAPADTIITGDVCNNTCLGFAPGDNAPDYLGLFGPVFGELVGPFTLDINAIGYALTINHHTLSFAFNDPHYSISFNSPLLSSFAPGAFEFIATGFNPYGIALAEAEFLCPTPGVPEISTWALMLIGFVMLDIAFLNRRKEAA